MLGAGVVGSLLVLRGAGRYPCVLHETTGGIFIDTASSASEPKERIQYLDLLKVLAILAVVFFHSAISTLQQGDGSAVWHFTNAITSLTAARLPLFFMVSGALLMSSAKTLSIGYTIKKRALRLLVPLLAWSVVYVGYGLVKSWRADGSADWSAAIDKLIHLPGTPVIVPLWFLYAMIGIYILSPILKRLVDSLSRNVVLYVLGLWAVFSCILPTIAAFMPDSLSPLFRLHGYYDLNFFSGYLGYFLLGYYLMKTDRSIPKKWLTLIVVIDAAVIALGSWWKTESLSVYSEIFIRHTHVFTVIMSCSVFLLFKELMRERRLGGFTAGAVGFLGPLVFGIYLAHALMIYILQPHLTGGSIGLFVVFYLAVLTASVALAAVLTTVKPLAYVFVGGRGEAWWRRKKTELGSGDSG